MLTFDSTRRGFLKAAAGATAGLWMTGGDVPVLAASTIMRKIPKSGEAVPAVGLGTSQTFDVTSGPDRDSCKEVLRRFAERGGRVVDSSPMYGAAEQLVGDLAAELGVGSKLFLATKVWTNGKEAGIRQMQDSMRKMRTSRFDLMQVHNLMDVQTHLDTLRAWKKEGKVRYLGVTHYRSGVHGELESLMKSASLDFVQLNYSMADRSAEDRALPAAIDTGTAILINVPFAKGQLFSKTRGQSLPEWAGEFDCTSWAQFFLKFVLGHPAVTCAIPATRNPDHVADNMNAGTGRLPDEKMRKRMVDYFAAL
ncbi:MAG: aldo/keto reductase [Terriglobales bacterium]